MTSVRKIFWHIFKKSTGRNHTEMVEEKEKKNLFPCFSFFPPVQLF